MSRVELIAPCHFGLESVLKKEILDLGYEIVQVEDGRITFAGDESAIARANIFIRTAERIMLKCGSFKAATFDELFEGTKAIAWEKYLTRDAKFWVSKATSNKSALFSPSDIQSIVKKAMVERLKQTYRVSWFTEDGASYPVRVFIFKDIVTIALDTSGVSLHKRGYRKLVGKAPIGDAGVRADHAHAVAQRQSPCRSVLRKWNISDRGGHDRRTHRTGNGQGVHGPGVVQDL